MKEFILTHTSISHAVLIGLVTPKQDEEKSYEYLDELEFLAQTAGIQSVRRFVQRLDCAHPISFVGGGKLQEIKEFIACEDHQISIAIFDDELTARQLRNIESALQVRIVDRTNLILNIFASRAKTAHAKTQVELAQYNYVLPRLTRLWTHLERQSGGGSGSFRMRGPGETQLETDRRIVLSKITHLKEKLKEIDQQKANQRNNRGQMVRVALVGYTNVGKSTLMNLLSKSEVFTENKLFATLDTTVRKITIHNLAFLLTDTVGFIRKLPTELIESFKSTLDEVRESDLLIHVVDISHPSFEEQLEVVQQTLKDITKKEEKPFIIVFNKTDAFPYMGKKEDNLTLKNWGNISLKELEKKLIQKFSKNCVFISAQQKQNIDELKKLLYGQVKQIYSQKFPYNHFLYSMDFHF